MSEFDELMKSGEYEKAIGVITKLIANDPLEVRNYEKKFHAYRKLGYFKGALASAVEGLEKIPGNKLLAHVEKAASVDLERSMAFKFCKNNLRTKVINGNVDCDVISIASNEGPYISDFIHHYLRMGFKNVYIGVNDSSKDETLQIINHINKEYPNVKIVDTNGINTDLTQYSNASYGKIWNSAIKDTNSKYALTVDIDELIILPNKFKNITELLESAGNFDCMSLSYLDQTGCSKPFAKPYDDTNRTLTSNPWTKSFVSYDADIVDLQPHIPILSSENRRPVCLTADYSERQPDTHYKNVFKVSDFLNANEYKRVDYENQPFIFHLRNRSELEYALKCVRSWPGQKTSFYANRQGFNVPGRTKFIEDIFQRLAPLTFNDEYKSSHSEFVKKCQIGDLIEKSKPSQEALDNIFRSIDVDVVASEEHVWRKSLRGTRFIEFLDKRIRSNDAAI